MFLSRVLRDTFVRRREDKIHHLDFRVKYCDDEQTTQDCEKNFKTVEHRAGKF